MTSAMRRGGAQGRKGHSPGQLTPFTLRTNATPTVARERWIDGWEAPALAWRLLVVVLAGKGVRCRALWRPGSGSNVDAGLERRWGRGVLDSKSPGTARGLPTYPKTSKSCKPKELHAALWFVPLASVEPQPELHRATLLKRWTHKTNMCQMSKCVSEHTTTFR
jgi:hypothetical protein